MVFIKIVVLILTLTVGILILKYTEPIVRLVGKSTWAEKFQTGGTYTMWKLIGLLIIILGIWYLVNG